MNFKSLILILEWRYLNMRNKVLSNDELFNNFPNDLNFLNNEEMNIDDVLSDIKKLNDFYYNYLI